MNRGEGGGQKKKDRSKDGHQKWQVECLGARGPGDGRVL